MRRFPFVQVDVFTDAPLAGNGLTVFTDARGLADAELLAIARETRQAETTFVFPNPLSSNEHVPVRIFSVSGELPFAGHPTLGTAAVLRATSSRPEVTLALKVGSIPVRFEPGAGPAFGEMRQNDPELGEHLTPEEAARGIGVQTGELHPGWPAQRASTGLPFLVIPLRDRAVLQRARPPLASLEPLLAGHRAQGVYLVAPSTEPGLMLHARMFDREGEDPATGSAAGACTGWMVQHGILASDARAVIAQGDELSRPSRIHVRARREAEHVTDVRVGGHVVEVARGELLL